MINDFPQTVAGQKVHIVEPSEVKVKRTWKERLFTWPFKPFKTHRTEWQEIVKDGEIFNANGVLMMNHRTYMELEREIAKRCKR